MGATANPNRRGDIAAALKRAKPADMLSLEDLAFIYGSTKGPFVTAKKNMVGMPPPTLQGTQHIYPARKALKAMLDYCMRNDAASAARQRQTDAILGTVHRKRKVVADTGLPARDLQILARLAAETEERERAQREYIPASEVAMTAGEVFSALSEFMAGLSNKVDPNGLLDPNLRALIDSGGEEALLGFHRRLKVLLNADVDHGDPSAASSGARKPRTRRKRA